MALNIKGSPQPIKSVGSLKQITKDPVAASAIRSQSSSREKDDKSRGGKRAGKA